MDPLSRLEISDLTGVRGGRLLFRGLSFAVAAGQALSIEGANGAGKSSLLRMLAGFLSPASGTIRLRTTTGDIEEAEERGKFIGWLGHLDAIKPQLSVAETLAFFAGLYGVKADIAALLDEVGLSRLADLPGLYLSAGQRKRLALARLKLCGRPLWLMDEPLASLDSAGKALAAAAIAAHCASGGLALIATHEPLAIDGARLVLAP